MRFRRFAAGFMAAIIVVTSSVPAAYADWEDVIYETVMVPFSELTVHAVESFADIIIGAGNALIRDPILKAHDFWSQWIRDESLEYREFVSTLDSTTASASMQVTGFSATTISAASSYPFANGLKYLVQDSSSNLLSVIEHLGVNDKVLILGICKDSPYYLMGVYFDANGQFMTGRFTNPFSRVNASYFGVYDLSSLELLAADEPSLLSGGVYTTANVFYNVAYAQAWSGFTSANCWAFDFTRTPGYPYSTTYKYPAFYFYFKSSSDTVFATNSSRWCFYNTSDDSGVWGYSSYFPAVGSISWNTSHIIVAPSGTDETSRTSALMQALDAYNAENMYDRHDTAVNYMIGTQADDGSVTDVYSPALYDEDTLVFTEPVSGNQYQTNGWTYDYTTRSYYMTLDSGTMYIDGTEVTAVYLVYGDDNVEISYLSGSGATELIQTDIYAYVMVSQSACNINGHTNTVETTKEPSCIAAGERTYTCSVCGNQTVEEIPMTDHAYEFSVLQEATCVGRGIDLYSCSTCGDEYTETTEALGHDFQPTSVVDTVYSFPDGVSCPSCSGTNFTYARSDTVYNCNCVDCGYEWVVDAEISYGATTYTCSRCSEIYVETEGGEDGLFSALARFISDGITWVTDKFTELAESLSGIHTTFRAYLERIRNIGGDFPALIAAAVGVMPSDFMDVVWFGVICMVLLAVYLKFFR